jgi:formate hydrogenlyase transcriptional activator
MVFSPNMTAPARDEGLPTSERLSALLRLTDSIVVERNLSKLFGQLAGLLHDVVNFNVVYVTLYDREREVVRLHLIDADFPVDIPPGHEGKADNTPSKWVTETQQPILIREADSDPRFPRAIEIYRRHGLHSFYMVPLSTSQRKLGMICFGSRNSNNYHLEDDLRFIQHVAARVAIAVDNALAYEEIEELKNRLSREKHYLEDEIRGELQFEEIVGESTALKQVFDQVRKVAPTDSTVLLLGETGTGKELIARSIHELSDRRKHTFVKINCSAIPSGLLESELFGHERGAFTSATSLRIGRFEIADGGTLFLDEIGDIPLEVQPKLLRVLQEREFERVGSSRTVRSDVRLIAATNRDLEEMVSSRTFRSDLFYRLNVFPVRMPALRERREDVPRLVRHFVQQYARQMNRQIKSISDETMRILCEWNWPGNVRELQNFVERAVILSTGTELDAPLEDLRSIPSAGAGGRSPIEESERRLILKALREVNWVIGGPSGAALRLGMKRTSLQSRMKYLGIVRPKASIH